MDTRRAVLLLISASLLVALGCGRARRSADEDVPVCERCHGGEGSAAPPRSARGETATTDRGVGAHRVHLRDGALRRAIACADCHVVPTEVLGHFGDPHATVTFPAGGLARAGSAAPEWRPDEAGGPTCAGVYCHGATLQVGGTATAPVWTRVDGTQKTCGACHGAPPTGARHPQGAVAARCDVCHPATVRADGTIDVAGGHHIDGRIDVALGEGCSGCHGAPPPTGAHLAHAALPEGVSAGYGAVTTLEDVAPAGGASYAFGCGQCHPLDPAKHLDGVVEVELGPAGAGGGTLRARNAPDAAYDPAAGTCSGVYCHSSGQASPAYVASPAWTAPPGALGCGGCHGDPPAYGSGGPGAPDANGHLQLQADGYEWGHFAGLPGPWHTTKHGGYWPGEDAAPITCQTCHADTVDPASTGPSGFYWLDTTGTYRLPGGQLDFACGSCHGTTGGPPTGAGRVLPLRHVNGRREVAFDPRTALPDLAWLPPPPDRPTRPYWVTHASPLVTIPDPSIPDAIMEGATLSLHLASARYDAAAKTCTSVACHLAQTSVTWGAAYDSTASCAACHGL